MLIIEEGEHRAALTVNIRVKADVQQNLKCPLCLALLKLPMCHKGIRKHLNNPAEVNETTHTHTSVHCTELETIHFHYLLATLASDNQLH